MIATRTLYPFAVGPQTGADLIGISRASLYRLMATGAIPYFKCGARTLIPTAGLQKYVEDRARENAS